MKVAVRNIRNLLRQCKGKLDQKIDLSGILVTGNKLIATDTARRFWKAEKQKLRSMIKRYTNVGLSINKNSNLDLVKEVKGSK